MQPCLFSDGGFQHPGERICGILTADGLVLNVYFPTLDRGKSREQYKEKISTFVDNLISVVEENIFKHPVSWIACGTDTNAHFKDSGNPRRKNDDFAAKHVGRFMRRFKLVSLAEICCPDKVTYISSRGSISCLDIFLESGWLYYNDCVTKYEVLDFLEHGSDHCPVYVCIKVYPKWFNRPKLPTKRIIKSAGVESLYMRLSDPASRHFVVNRINICFF